MFRAWLPAALIVGALGTYGSGRPLIAHESVDSVTAESALAELKAGNEHHMRHRYTHPHESTARQRELVKAQHPHAIILSCADSRVPPEIVFDQGLGDLFTVRVAGNVADDAVIGSIEYAADHLHAPLLVVLGHESCGAVTAATEAGAAPGHLPTIVKAIQPAVERARSIPGDLLANAVRLNVEMVVTQLRASSPILSEMVTKGHLRVVGAVYSLQTGRVTWLPENAAVTTK